jgi:hypothetical protein
MSYCKYCKQEIRIGGSAHRCDEMKGALPPATGSALLEWLRGKLAEAEKHLQFRIEGAEMWRSGTDESWKAAARLSGEKASTKAERLRTAESFDRIAVKCRREVEMFKAAIASLNRMEELHTVITGDWESKDAFVSRVRSILFPQNEPSPSVGATE